MPNEAVLHYLGYKGQSISSELAERIDDATSRCARIARPAATWRAFDPQLLQLPGQSIAQHLAGAVEVVLMAATIGHGIDRELRRLSMVDPLGQVVFDAAATAYVEQEADKTEAQIRAHAHERDLHCSWRFSPGYGDLPLDIQADLLTRLDATRRLGITLTPSNLMVPTKSVTAIVGLHPTQQPGMSSACEACTIAKRYKTHCGFCNATNRARQEVAPV